MLTEIYIISGFLGAGKTTLIRKLLREAFLGERIVVVENDFAEAGADAALLKAEGAAVEEIRAGCICCSLSGDLVKSLKKLLARHKPDKIFIEPSGVGKLSDVAAVCMREELRTLAEVKRRITVVDAARCAVYAENFGEFFTDQIEHADAVLLSRVEGSADKAEAARALVRAYNEDAELFCAPWETLRAEDLLSPRRGAASEALREGAGTAHCHDEHDCDAHCHGEHGHDAHCHGEHCHGEHCHGAHDCDAHGASAEEVFDSVTIRTERVFSGDELRARVSRMERDAAGTVLRAKGILRGTEGYLHLEYVPGDTRIEPCAAGGDDMLSVIGRDLNGPDLAAIFGGVV
ncbi:MAG: GTP-binding protein [Clostridiales Family XIII bacterium]|jgi:G3E family GTPase|nr:GTP-binding protein [Clostridiales Family XIII bacterium]